MKKVLFIDRDGTIIQEPEDYQIDDIEKFSFCPGVISSLRNIVDGLDYTLVMVTNQDGLGTDSYPESDFWPYHELMLRTLEGEGINFSEVLIDRSFPEDNSPYRKPAIGLVKKYLSSDYNLEQSLVIGDRWSDIKLAKNLGCQSILVAENTIDDNPEALTPTLQTGNWREIESFLFRLDRKAKAIRKTNETGIVIGINLDGEGRSEINTGLGFYDHMLEQIAKHGHLDLFIETKGDLEVDEHHTIEDTAILLGQVFRDALGKKAGINRYGFSLPMDDAQAHVLMDFGGRPWLEWDVQFQRDKIGDVPTEMFYHFFKSFADNAHCNLNISAAGDNEHHLIEGVYKAFAKAIKMAKERNVNDYRIPSTKGTL